MKKYFIQEYWESRFKNKTWYDIRLNNSKMFYRTNEKYRIIINGGEYGTAMLIGKQNMTLKQVPEKICREGFDGFNRDLVCKVLERIYASEKGWDDMNTCVSVLEFRWIEQHKPMYRGLGR